MRKETSLIRLLSFVAILMVRCQSEERVPSRSHVARLTITCSASQPVSIKVGTIHPFNFADSVLAERTSGTTDTTSLTVSLSEPTLAYLSLNETSHTLYLSPGDDLKVSVDTVGGLSVSTYAEIGSAVNRYLMHVEQIKQEFVQRDGQYLWDLNEETFLPRLDSMRQAYHHFHRQYTDTVVMPEKLQAALKDRNRLMVVSQLENYELAHYADRSPTTDLRDAYYDLPWDTTFLANSLLEYDYALALTFYLELRISWPLYDRMEKEESASVDTLPMLVDRTIRGETFPDAIKDFLRAKNISNALGRQGITSIVDTLLHTFREEYPTSAWTASLEEQYQRWQALASGRRAPEITGITPEGQLLSLSDLRGKVVYVDVWATWCGPCRQEFPYSKKLQQQFEGDDRVAFLYVSIDQQEDQEKWKDMIVEHGLHGIHIRDVPNKKASAIREAYRIGGIPRYILIDQNSKLVDAEAARPSSGRIKESIQRLLSTTN